MAIIVSREPALFIPEKGLVVYHRPHETTLVSLSEIVEKAGELKGPVATVLSNLLLKLRDLSISFRSIDLHLEHDYEIPSWEYAVVGVELEVDQWFFDSIEDMLVSHAYSDIQKEDTTKVLLVLTRV